jgi:AcrR family transcriptional regulator
MNHVATSREALLEIAVKLTAEKGPGAINIRDIAGRAGISVGCVYRYFPSKADLMTATVERIWEDIFRTENPRTQPKEFVEYVGWLYGGILNGSERYPAFFTLHAANFAAGEIEQGRRVMSRFLSRVRLDLSQALEEDTGVRRDAFAGDFTEEAFVAFVFDNLVMLALKQAPSCDFLLSLIRKAIY